MPINIKNDRVERLLDEVTALTGEFKTEAVRRALEEPRDRLTRSGTDLHPADRLRRLLVREIWPVIPAELRGGLLARLQQESGMAVMHVTETHVGVAMDAWMRFGKGRHPAALNFGDCLSYAMAIVADEPLLCVGDDFPQTDCPLA